VACARSVIGDEPFGVILPDDLIVTAPGRAGALRQMAGIVNAETVGAMAVEEVAPQDTGKYGIVDAEETASGAGLRIRHVVEKPAPEVAPSNLAIVGRYVLPGRIFELLDEVQPGAGGEIQLTDAIAMLLARADVRAWRFEGTRFDCGSKLGLVKATLHMAMRDPQLAGPTREFIGTL
jgi:UTP--glucose-1-phosphate uridylyltransferase